MNSEIKVHVIDRGRRNFYMRYADPDGKRIERSTGVKTGGKKQRREADKVAGKWEAELQEGRYRNPDKTTWLDFRERVFDEYVEGQSDNYRVSMASAMTRFEDLAKPTRLNDITGDKLSRFVAQLRQLKRKDGERRVNDTSIRTYLMHLKAAFNWGHRIGLLHEVPYMHMPRPRGKKMKGRPVVGEEFDRMLLAVNDVCPWDVQGWQDALTQGCGFQGCDWANTSGCRGIPARRSQSTCLANIHAFESGRKDRNPGRTNYFP